MSERRIRIERGDDVLFGRGESGSRLWVYIGYVRYEGRIKRFIRIPGCDEIGWGNLRRCGRGWKGVYGGKFGCERVWEWIGVKSCGDEQAEC